MRQHTRKIRGNFIWIFFILSAGAGLLYAGQKEISRGDRALSEFSIGVAYSTRGECDKAIPHFENALDLYPAPEIYIELAECYAYGGSVPKAIELLEESLGKFPGVIDTHRELGNMYFDMYTRSGVGTVEMAENALEHLKKACQAEPDYYLCAKAIDIAINLKNFGTAARVFELLDLEEVSDYRMIAYMISIYNELEDKAHIAKLTRNIAYRDVDNTALLDDLVNICITHSLYNEALPLMKKIEEIQGSLFNLWDKYMFVALGASDFDTVKSIYNMKFSDDPTSLALYSMANSYAQEHNYKEAIKYFRQVIDKGEDGWKERIIKDLYKDYMTVLVAAGMEEEALKQSNNYRLQYPDDTYSIIDYFYLSLLVKDSTYTGVLIDQIESVVENKNFVNDIRRHHEAHRDFLKYRYKGLIFQSLNDYEKAEAFLKKAFDIDPSDVDTGVPLAAIYENQKRKDDVIEVYTHLIKYHPENPLILNNMGYTLLVYQEQLDYAMKLTKKAVKLAPENPVYRDSLGYAYYLNNNFDDAEEHLLFAYDKVSDDPEICLHLGDLYFKKGDFKKAEIFFHKAIVYGSEEKEMIQKKLDIINQ